MFPEGASAAAATAEVLREVNAAHGMTHWPVRPMLGGFQSGAWLIQDEADRLAVLKWSPDRTWADQIRRATRAVAEVRQQGYPTPAWLASGVTRSGFGYQVQEYVAGSPREHVTEKVARILADLLELQSGLDPDPERSWSEYVTTCFRNEWASTVGEVTATGAAGAELAAHAVQLISRYEFPTLPSPDLVHGDFRLGNVLFVDDKVSGVVDVEALGSGTRAFDYATLLDHEYADDDAIELLVTAGSQVAGPAALAHCLVHVFLDLALFMKRRPPTVAPGEPDRRTATLSTRVQLVSRLLP